MAARLLQGLSASSGIVISRAIVSDRVSGPAAVRVFSVLMTIVGVAPAVAPLAGSLVSAAAGWRGVLWVVAGLAVVMLLGMLLVVRESHPVAKRRSGALLGGLGEAAKHPRFMGYVLLGGSNFGVLMGVISASPFLYQSMMGFSPQVYGLFFGINALGMMASGIVSSKLAVRVPRAAHARRGRCGDARGVPHHAGFRAGRAAADCAGPVPVPAGVLDGLRYGQHDGPGHRRGAARRRQRDRLDGRRPVRRRRPGQRPGGPWRRTDRPAAGDRAGRQFLRRALRLRCHQAPRGRPLPADSLPAPAADATTSVFTRPSGNFPP